MIAFFLKIWTFLKGKLKYIGIAVLALSTAVCGGVAGSKARQLKEADTQITVLQQSIAEKNELIAKLAAMEAVRCEVSITVKNTAVMGANHSGNIAQEAEQISTYLRGQLLDKLLKNPNNKY